jgi:AcrR family transcriptional regulator
MAPPTKHPSDRILDAARTLALTDGPRAVSVAAIAEASGAPAGTLYHRFGNRDGILRAAWLRALERFQARWLEAARDPDPLEAGVAMATSVVAFARACPDDARLLLTLRPRDLLDAGPDAELRELQRAMNAPLEAELRRVARALRGRADARALDGVVRATIDLPYGTVRRHAHKATMPRWLERDVAAAARHLLTAPRTQPRERSRQQPAARPTARSTASRSDRDEIA